MKILNRPSILLALFLVVTFNACNQKKNADQIGHFFYPDQILRITQKVANWQLANPNETVMGDWVQGPFLNGLMAIGKLPGNQGYIDSVRAIAEAENWGVINTIWKANDHCSPQAWLELYEMERQPERIQPIREALDTIMAITAMQNDNLDFKQENKFKWSWCDALFMSPPTFARLAAMSGEQAYLDYMHEWWWKVSDYYYDEEEHLYFRDENFFEKREPNGEKVFWSRGNGWVVGDLYVCYSIFPRMIPNGPCMKSSCRRCA